MFSKLPKIFLYFLGFLLVLNLLQSYFTELIFDEAYYWYYAKNLSWGYFDHPPMVAFMIKLGMFFFQGELGVRFVSCLLALGNFYFLWQIIDHPKKDSYIKHFLILVFSITLLNAYGFFTLPDTPLLFFTTLFLWTYKKFLQHTSIGWALFQGVVMAALMYSKYHAALIILFVLLSNLKLVRNKYAWLSVGVALACYTPHFIWLYENNFIAIKYHLFERPNRAYEFGDFTVGYFVNLVAIFGLTFPWIYRALIKTKEKDLFTNALRYLVYGILIFFFISSFNRRIQTQWIIAITVPMALLSFRYLLQDELTRKWLYRMGLINIILLLYIRLGLIFPTLLPITYETHGNKKTVNAIRSQVGDMPVIFENSYRMAPMYAFYSGNKSYSLNNINYRQNQYTIDNSEAMVQNKKVVYISRYLESGEITYHDSKGILHYGKYIDDFESFRKLETFVTTPHVELETTPKIEAVVYNPYPKAIALEKLKFGLVYLNPYKQLNEVLPIAPQWESDISFLKTQDTTKFSIQLPHPKKAHPSYFKISISENNLPFGLNGTNNKIR